MSSIHSHIRANTCLFFSLPSDLFKLVEIKPDTIIEVGKLGSFPSNLLLGRPYYYTYEILERRDNEPYSRLRIVPPSELNAETIMEEPTPSESRGEPATPVTNGVPEAYDLLGESTAVVMKNNRLTIDDGSRQALSQQEIEELKKSFAGREVIEKILANHAGLDEKTEFAKAKYTLRKTKKYLKRFTALPMNMANLIKYVGDKESTRIMDLREETLALILAWSNVHCHGDEDIARLHNGKEIGGGRWLVADETGGLLTAAMAEKMGILHPGTDNEDDTIDIHAGFVSTNTGEDEGEVEDGAEITSSGLKTSSVKQIIHRDFPHPAKTNALTLIHPAVQPNLSLLKYFGYDTNQPDTYHPLHTHLKPLSWLQLLHPEEDPTYREPERLAEHELQALKSGKRGAYWKKRRRWERCKGIVDETREGGFDGLVVASSMDPATILVHTVALVRGGGHVVVYSPTVEPLVRLMDLYSRERRTAYIQHLAKGDTPDSEDFPLDPRLLLAPTLQTSRIRDWQVLPGRTHPMMTARGGAEGYVFTARRVVPLEGGVEARGNFSSKKRNADGVVG